MKIFSAAAFLFVFCGSIAASAQVHNMPSVSSMRMEIHGGAVTDTKAAQKSPFADLDQFSNDIPTNELSRIAQNPIVDATATTRSANDVQLFREISPSVVYVANKEGFGSAPMLDTSGDILTNWHVVNGYEFVAVIFKPANEGQEPTRDDIKLARVVKYDEISDLALIKSIRSSSWLVPIRLGDPSDIAVGMMYAIGHPEGDAWTYTTGVISQYRRGYAWRDKGDNIKHNADVIQTQNPHQLREILEVLY